MSQYEPIVLKKKQLRTVAGTPASLVYNLLKSTLLVIPIAGMFWFSEYIIKKKKLIAELDEYDFFNKKMTRFEEYMATRDVWDNPYLHNVVSMVLEKYDEKGELTTINENSLTRAEIKGENK